MRRVPLRRVSELNTLRGPQFLMSLLLELVDLAAPALRALWKRSSGESPLRHVFVSVCLKEGMCERV